MSRLSDLLPENLTPDQKQLYDKIAGDKRRQSLRSFQLVRDDGSLTGPFNALLYSPAVGDAAQSLGGALRFQSSLPGYLRELAILTVAAHWRADYEWYAHAGIAAKEGLDESVIEGVKQDRIPADAPDEVLTVHGVIRELCVARKVSDKTFAAAKALVGEHGLVELIAVFGYYSLLAGLLNTFEVGVPEGADKPFSE